jgi:hypothetical protein
MHLHIEFRRKAPFPQTNWPPLESETKTTTKATVLFLLMKIATVLGSYKCSKQRKERP